MQFLLSAQSEFLLPRASLQTCMAHVMRSVPRDSGALVTHMRRTDGAVWRAPAAELDLPPGEGECGASMDGPDKACSILGRQMLFLLRHGGLGLRMH